MQNVEWEIKGDKLIIEIDLTKDFGPSKSGKTITIAVHGVTRRSRVLML